MDKKLTSTNLYSRASKFIPGGVNSPVRSFVNVGSTPVFIKKANGAYLIDEDGNAYIDLINSWGPMILGHNNPKVVRSIIDKTKEGISFGTPTRLEVEMAELICAITNIDMVRLVCSGTEACMSAIRLARAFTKKNKFIKFEGCYHGHSDAFLVSAGSGVETLKIDNVSGVTYEATKDTILVPFNDIEALERSLLEHKNEIAAIIIEPVAGNMGCIPPNKGYLEAIRLLCDQYNCLLIFDEVMTGFRLSIGGVQQLMNVKADLVTYGKVIGGGLPIGAFGGRREIMQLVAPSGNVYQAGTLSGNPICVSAGLQTLKILQKDTSIYKRIEAATIYLKKGISEALHSNKIEHSINQIGSMMSVHFSKENVVDFNSAKACDTKKFNRFFHHFLNNGIHLPPSSYESWFISDSLTKKELDKIIDVTYKFKG